MARSVYPTRASCDVRNLTRFLGLLQVKYWVLGPEDGQKVVLVHGLSMPSIVFKDVAPALASNGFRVLVYGASSTSPIPIRN